MRDYRVNGIRLTITDIPTTIAPLIIHEIKTDDYGLDRPPFTSGDVVIDIGGHIGVVALYLAKKYPFIKVHAFEPAPVNYESFKQNIALNGVENVTVDNCAVTKDRRSLDMIMNVENTGGATGQLQDMRLPGREYFAVPSITLDDIFERYGFEHCRLLKIDCEGSEYEILMTTGRLDRIDWLSGEFHINTHLENLGYSIDGLVQHLRQYIAPEHITYTTTRMAE